MPRSLAAFGFLAIIGLAVIAAVYDHHQFTHTQETFHARVLNKERRCHMVSDYEDREDSHGNTYPVKTGEHEECTNLVHTDRETLENDGVIWAGVYNTDAMQGRLVPGETYTFVVYGTGDENMGVYRKIIKVAKIVPGGGQMGGGGSSNW